MIVLICRLDLGLYSDSLDGSTIMRMTDAVGPTYTLTVEIEFCLRRRKEQMFYLIFVCMACINKNFTMYRGKICQIQ